MEKKSNRGSFGSNIGFLLAAIGSAVGLGNIWGFPYKMGKSGGFTFLLVYFALAIFVGFIIMVSELALGRKSKKGAIGAYYKNTKKFKWIGWLALLAPFLIMSFYSVLGGYCLQYLSLNLSELSFNLQKSFSITLSGGDTFTGMLTNPIGCAAFTLLFLIICFLINRSNVSEGIEKFNKIGMPALFVMLIIIIMRSVTLPGASEGLKFMFVPGYAVKAGFIESSPNFISVLATAGGQMFFSLSLAMGAMITYGSYLNKEENLKKNSVIIVIADTLVAMLAGIAVIPAAVANGIASGTPLNEIALGGPKLLFVTLQDVFASMGAVGAIFGAIFYALVLIAAISSAISLIEVITAYFVDFAEHKKKTPNRSKIVFWVCVAIAIEATLVAVDGLGASGLFKWAPAPMWKDCFLDFMDCWSEGIAMPLGAMLMALMIGWELKSKPILDEIEIGSSNSKAFTIFYKVCIMVIAPIAMAFIFAGQMIDFFVCAETAAWSTPLCYGISGLVLIVFWIVAFIGGKKKEEK